MKHICHFPIHQVGLSFLNVRSLSYGAITERQFLRRYTSMVQECLKDEATWRGDQVREQLASMSEGVSVTNMIATQSIERGLVRESCVFAVRPNSRGSRDPMTYFGHRRTDLWPCMA